MAGGALACLGMVASSFSHTLSQLYIAAGFFTGDCHPIWRIAGPLLKSTRLKGAGQAKLPVSGAAHWREPRKEGGGTGI